MTKYHEWKRRLWGGDYPIENGPPYRLPDGSPVFPGASSGPVNGVDDNGPATGNPVVITFSGTATDDTEVLVIIDDNTASAPAGGRVVGANIVAASGSTANQIGDLIAADFNARAWPGWIGASNAGGVVTFTPQAAGSATGQVFYSTAPGGSSGTGGINLPPNPLPPGGVDGPNQSQFGVDFWLSRSGGQGTLWYYWIDVDSTPGPDTKRPLLEFLQDDNIDDNYRNDVEVRARDLGWGG